MTEQIVDQVPIYQKHCLTIKEAAKVFGIGEHEIRRQTKIRGNNYTLKIGTKTLIKREIFADYINDRNQL